MNGYKRTVHTTDCVIIAFTYDLLGEPYSASQSVLPRVLVIFYSAAGTTQQLHHVLKCGLDYSVFKRLYTWGAIAVIRNMCEKKQQCLVIPDKSLQFDLNYV